jgi:hypothetical protein
MCGGLDGLGRPVPSAGVFILFGEVSLGGTSKGMCWDELGGGTELLVIAMRRLWSNLTSNAIAVDVSQREGMMQPWRSAISFLAVLCVWECETAACRAFSLANAKGTGTDDWVIRSLD